MFLFLKRATVILFLLLSGSIHAATPFSRSLTQLAEVYQPENSNRIQLNDIYEFLDRYEERSGEDGWNKALDYLNFGRNVPLGRKAFADAIVFLMHDPERSGALTQIAKWRLEEVAKLFLLGKGKKVLISGGAPNSFEIWNTAAEFLVAQGVPQDVIFFEDVNGKRSLSANTYENITYSLEALKKLGAQSAIFVSSPYHLERIFRYIDKAVAAGSYRLAEVFWSSYPSYFDDRNIPHKKQQIAHEILSVIRDRQLYGNELFSSKMPSKLDGGLEGMSPINRCSEFDRSVRINMRGEVINP